MKGFVDFQTLPRKLAWATGVGYTAPVPPTPMATALPATQFGDHGVVVGGLR